MSCSKLMHVFSTDIGLLFCVLDHSPSTYSIKPNYTFGSERGFWRTGGVVGHAGGTYNTKAKAKCCPIAARQREIVASSVSVYIARARVCARTCACVRVKLGGKLLRVGVIG